MTPLNGWTPKDARGLATVLQSAIADWMTARYSGRTDAWANEAYLTVLSGLALVTAYHLAALNVVGKATTESDGPLSESVLTELGGMVRALIPTYEAHVRTGLSPKRPEA